MVPPAPPPPPMSPTSFSKGNWSVKTKSSNDGTAEGSVEIPERQSVASLREQIANKLEVKAPNGTKAIVHNARERHRSCVTPTSFERPPKSVLPLRFSADISAPINGSQPYVQQAPTQNHTPDSTAQIGKPIVHEPAKRHISCITPLPFSRSLPESASLQSVPVVTPASEKSFTSDYHSNYESTPLPQSTSNDGFQASVDYSEKPSIRENNIATFARNSDFSSKFNVENEGRDSAIDLTPPVKLASNEPTKFTNGYASDHMLASPSSAMSASSAQPEMPPFSTPYDPETQRLQEAHHAHTSPASRSGVPAGSRDAPALSLLQADGASKRDDSLKQRYASISQRRTPTPDAAMHQQSDTSFWYKNMFKMMHKIEQRGE
ncbi:unnamed protein product [Toxocara canis]|uniref:WH2 domain-containing protein n=1 Tax=Toxocara canis TaxID=6265 RepID=A0A183TY11_TOXCA|nr:unnamed protein product [Toxocara canis]